MAKILQFTPHRIFPPRGGRRAFFYQRELAREHDVTLIVPQLLAEFDGVKDHYTMPEGVTIYSSLDKPAPKTAFDLLGKRLGPALLHRWLIRSTQGPAAIDLLNHWHLFKEALEEEQFDIVIFDHIQTLPMARVVARLQPSAIRMLNAHNVDYMLYERLAEGTDDPVEKTRWMQRSAVSKHTESTLAEVVHGYWACSDEDHQELQRLNGGKIKGYPIPNGIATEVLPFDDRADKCAEQKILFCGSLNYEPNRRGLEWFRQLCWDRIKQKAPEATLTIIGYGAADDDFPELRADPRVDFIGEVESVAPWYHKTGVALAPILEGSGTRVKILEAMALGNPVVATTIGAEGIKATDGENIFLRDDPEGYADAVVECMQSEDTFYRLQKNGRALVDQVYDWRVVGRELNETVEDILSSARS